MRKRILYLLTGTAALALVAPAASAADLPVQAPPPAPVFAPPPVFTWSGFYVGVNAGYGWAENNNESVFVPAGEIGPGSPAGTISYTDESGDGFVGGGQIGYNYQIGSFVIGLETDIQWADLGADRDGAVFPAVWRNAYDFRAAGVAGGIDWFGTVRARAGVAFDRLLVYATGGFAYGSGDTNDEFDGLLFGDDGNDVRTGWVIGGGVEWAIPTNFGFLGSGATIGLEGLWVNLDQEDNGTYIGSVAVPGGREPVFASVRNSEDNEFFVARAKLNFKFGTY
ncbi:outer membrane protein [Microvirga roseola]|uniref:outer membrane protein n=1 Tax=Microvirga roseola TaxID=2883126 RepID=UPI001E35C92E|nr:porin family protein [Microvirga roseola]